MSTTLIMYMPGHAGNFILRLFALSESFMPVLPKSQLTLLVNNACPLKPNINNRLSMYKFSNVWNRYRSWQDFHRAFADFLEYQDYRLLNLISGTCYNFIYAIHPHEFKTRFIEVDETDYYYVHLDTKFDSWVSNQQKKLNFVWRDNEDKEFDELKTQYNMKPISLTALLSSTEEFLNEYLRVCSVMNIQPEVDQALLLREDWQTVRFQKP